MLLLGIYHQAKRRWYVMPANKSLAFVDPAEHEFSLALRSREIGFYMGKTRGKNGQ
jgi:putative AlgH/UPF0301 family transcriptional regulator